MAPGDTIRSKIEKKLTKEKLRDRENAAHPNTPWAPSGPERIYIYIYIYIYINGPPLVGLIFKYIYIYIYILMHPWCLELGAFYL